MLVELRGGPLGATEHALVELEDGTTEYHVPLKSTVSLNDASPTVDASVTYETVTYKPTDYCTFTPLGTAQVWALSYEDWQKHERWRRGFRSSHG